jgi:hypothetical protein
MARGATLATKTASDTAAIGSATPALPLRGRALTDAEAGRPLLDVRGVTMQYKTQAHLVTATYRVSFNGCKAIASSWSARPAAASRPCSRRSAAT